MLIRLGGLAAALLALCQLAGCRTIRLLALPPVAAPQQAVETVRPAAGEDPWADLPAAGGSSSQKGETGRDTALF